MILSRPKTTISTENFNSYISLVEKDNPLWQMELNHKKTINFLENLAAENWDFTYQEGKWTIRELMIHIIDTERILSTRAMRIARGEEQNLTGFDHVDYVDNCHADMRSALSILEEYKAVRMSTLCLFNSIYEGKLDQIGQANAKNICVRSLAFIIAGHEMHHYNVLEERYFSKGKEL